MGGGFGGMGGMGGATEDAEEAEKSPWTWNKVLPDVSAEEVGELFRYDIQLPVALPRNRSAMFPIVNQPVAGEKVSIYKTRTHAKHPLHGLRLTNDTALHLTQDRSRSLTEASMPGTAEFAISRGAARLVSYALDLDLQVEVRTTEIAARWPA